MYQFNALLLFILQHQKVSIRKIESESITALEKCARIKRRIFNKNFNGVPIGVDGLYRVDRYSFWI
jgi:hypothetical protein